MNIQIQAKHAKKELTPLFSYVKDASVDTLTALGTVHLHWRGESYMVKGQDIADLIAAAYAGSEEQLQAQLDEISLGRTITTPVATSAPTEISTPLASGNGTRLDVGSAISGFLDTFDLELYKDGKFVVNSSDILGIDVHEFSISLAKKINALSLTKEPRDRGITPARVFLEITTCDTIAEAIVEGDKPDSEPYISYFLGRPEENGPVDNEINLAECLDIRDALEQLVIKMLNIHAYAEGLWHNAIMVAIDQAIVDSYIGQY